MRLTDLLALSHVPRWAIVDVERRQTVSDHTFRTLVIALELTDRLQLTLSAAALLHVLCHDGDESRTGDIPASLKDRFPLGSFTEVCPWLEKLPPINDDEKRIIHLADLIEAFTYVSRYGVGGHANRVKGGLLEKIDKATPAQWYFPVSKVIEDIMEDRER